MYSSPAFLSRPYPKPPVSSWKDLGSRENPYWNCNLNGVPLHNAPVTAVLGIQEIEGWYQEHGEFRDAEMPLASALYRREQPWHTAGWNEDWCPRGTTQFVKTRMLKKRPATYDEDHPHPWTGDYVFGPEKTSPQYPPLRRYTGPSELVLHHGIHHGNNVPVQDLRRKDPEPTPALRVEEIYQQGKCRPIVPVDFKGFDKLPHQARNREINAVHAALDQWQPSLHGAVQCGGLVPTRRTNEYDCPIS